MIVEITQGSFWEGFSGSYSRHTESDSVAIAQKSQFLQHFLDESDALPS